MAKRLIAFVVMSLWLVAAVPVATADTGDIIEPQSEPPTPADGWQANVCTTDTPPCSPETPGNFFLEAGGHPPIGFTQYFLRHEASTGKVEPAEIEIPTSPLVGQVPAVPNADRTVRTLRVDLPPGLSVNPEATPRCSLAEFEVLPIPECEPNTIVGREEVTLVVNTPGVVPAPSPPFPAGNTLPVGAVIPPSEATGTKVPVYNLEPKPGEPALFGFVIAGSKFVFLETDVAWDSDYHQSFTIRPPAPSLPVSTLKSRLVSLGEEPGNGTYISNPTTCFSPNEWQNLYSTWYRAESYGEEPNPAFPEGVTPFEAKVEDDEGNLYQQTNCAEIPFDPSIEVNPGTNQIDSPAPADVVTEIPFEVPTEGGKAQSQSHLRKAVISLPEGMGLNPSGSNGLVACSDADFKKGQRVENNTCPVDSKIGSVAVETPALPPGSLTGDVYVGEQQSNDPESGNQFRILAEAKSEQYGVVLRLIGHTAANKTTGRLTTTFDEQEVGPLAGSLPNGLPQQPFESVRLSFDGSKQILTSPPTCAPAQTTGEFEPWARPGTQTEKVDSFTLSSDPGGGSCPTTLGARRFTPGYSADTSNSVAGADTKFDVHVGRGDGEQEVKGVDITLPEGLIGSLAGLLYCPDVNLEVAEQKTAYQETVNPSCPEVSQIGTATTKSGSGPDPISLGGSAYLAGPYKGAPLSLAVITPASSGPFDLGTVVVRVALYINPETTEIHAVSDPIPDVFGGVKLDLRSIDVHVDRPQFMRNGTDCSEPMATRGSILGGGSNPANPGAFSSYDVSAYYRPAECGKLKFKPKLYTRLFGGTRRTAHPQLRAVLEARKGDANIERSALTLPHALFLDQGNIKTVCTRVQLGENNCPKAAIYGHAVARSPLLDGKLEGPVYLVSSDNTLPDLLVNLTGQVTVRLRAEITSPRGGIKTVFHHTPDVPVSKLILRMQGGKKKGLLINSRNLCQGKLSSYMNLKAHNSRRVRVKQLKLAVPCGKSNTK